MKYSASTYAKALAEAIVKAKPSDGDRIVARFVALVRRNGDDVHIRKIVEEAARFVRGAHGIRKVTLGSARPLTAAQRKLLKHFVTEEDIVEERVDPTLIAGIRITVDDETQFDGSLKRKLDAMFTVGQE